MEIGIVYPQTESRGDPTAVGRIGRATEELGFTHLLAYDHVVGAVHADRDPKLWGPYTDQDPFHDPFVMFAYLAGITQRIGFATGVIILPQRQTVLVAKQSADLDLLSGGRLRLGVGVGWNYVEYHALGQEFETRGARANEQIGLLRRLWAEPLLSATRVASTGWIVARFFHGRIVRSRSGSADSVTPRSTGRPSSAMGSCSRARSNGVWRAGTTSAEACRPEAQCRRLRGGFGDHGEQVGRRCRTFHRSVARRPVARTCRWC